MIYILSFNAFPVEKLINVLIKRTAGPYMCQQHETRARCHLQNVSCLKRSTLWPSFVWSETRTPAQEAGNVSHPSYMRAHFLSCWSIKAWQTLLTSSFPFPESTFFLLPFSGPCSKLCPHKCIHYPSLHVCTSFTVSPSQTKCRTSLPHYDTLLREFLVSAVWNFHTYCSARCVL